ncbi:ImmA/IrrE family metallo-endopeptidase [Staphylococcus pseudintermedius]|uniref:ImmA/IrrE family metallo-endopeptidase n=1 Tax=Staphylococcus pseudintermedius TaxID=283734 RepID=UPI0019F8764E|nr:toxin [Staphylococcus pseudintermedius]EGQ3927895.1 ImmA/IrrE family metallo-endopeptidase [Staphylococcus pseudintermedius]EGQ3935519.1 ImmA/IrrE family metallo-endopeptidase [Staphylococcus pseudintermedius]EHP0513645.1 ImmA/IrrE family metallo-endopeptidase [Staphylococcus pseudintermedius]EHT7952027.1 ImmA/IrrE family metallo-endopeptidase [Staphylococcus pseudintermedius]
MSKYEELLIKHDYIDIEDKYNLPGNFKGFYDNDVILVDSKLNTYQKHEILAEEIAHYKISAGNILDQSNMLNRKFELKARRLANETVISLQGLINAFNYGVQNLFELALYFEVTKAFVLDTIQHYKQKYGLSVSYGGYIIKFEPLTIYKNI